jgi:hypothetical protein
MKATTLCSTLLFAVATVLAGLPSGLSAKTLGMVANDGPPLVTVFDGDTHAVLGTVPIGFGSAYGDVLITPDLKKGFVTNFGYQVHVIDLTVSPPALAGGVNPIPISNAGEDLAISPDGKFLVVSDGSNFEPISVVDIATQAEISTFSTGTDTNSLDVCSDGSVLATSFTTSLTLRRLVLSGTGTLTDTGEVLSEISSSPMNVYCAPGAQSGVLIQSPGGISSFSVPGLTLVDNRPLSGGSPMAGAIAPAGSRVFARSSFPGSIDVFTFNPATGTLGASPLLVISVADAPPYFGMDQVALHPNGTKLFVSERAPGAVNVYDPSTGALLASITDPSIGVPTGVTVVTEVDPCAGSPPSGAIVGTNGANVLNGTSGNDKIFGLGGPDIINGGGGNDLICGGDGPDISDGGSGNDVLNTKDGVSGNDVANGNAGNDTCVSDPGDVCSP